MRLNPYLSFGGQCEEAFRFYEQCLGGQLGPIFHYAGSPMADQVPADWQNKVMHGSVTIGDQVLMGADVGPEHHQELRGFSLSLHLKDLARAERIFGELVEGGRVVLPLEKTFWSELFGMAVDRFGVPWLINCDGAE